MVALSHYAILALALVTGGGAVALCYWADVVARRRALHREAVAQELARQARAKYRRDWLGNPVGQRGAP